MQRISISYIRVLAGAFVAFVAALMCLVLVQGAHAAGNISVSQPDGSHYVRGTTTIAWGIADPSHTTSVNLLYSTNFSTWANLVSSIATTTTSFDWNTTTLADDTYEIKVTGVPTGEFNTSATFTIDNTPPTTTATVNPSTPDGLNNWYVTTPTITLSCTDSGSGCGNTYYAWDGTGTTTYAGPISGMEGDHVLSYWSEDQAVDKYGNHNVETAHTQEIKVDTVPPTISSYTLNGGASDVYLNPHSAGASTTIMFTASEPVHWTTLRVQSATNTATYKDFHPSPDSTTATEQWTGDLSTSASLASDGAYDFTYNITDVAGNTTNTESGTPLSSPQVIVDTQAPTITGFTSPVADAVYTSANILTFTPTDMGGVGTTPITCSYSLNGGATSTIACSSGTAVTAGSLSGLVDGRNTLTLSVSDAAGNSVTEAPVSFVYDNNNTLTVSSDSGDHADFSTIGAAITASDNASLSGETIDVYPGTGPYNENVSLDNAFTLQGHTGNAADVAVTGQITLNANNDTVKNLTVTNPSGIFGILINGVSNATVTGNMVNHIGTAGSITPNAWGIYYQSHSTGDTSGITITHNTVSNIGDATDSQSNGGISIGDSHGAGTISGALIDNNTVSSVAAKSGKGAYGILVNHGASAGGSTNVTITNNTVSDLSSTSGWATAIGLEANTPNADVEHNTISNVSNPAGVGINVEDNTSADSIVLHYNSVNQASVSYLVANKVPSTTVDATKNWWGTAVRSTIAPKMLEIPGLITFEPYYVDAAMTILSNTPVSDVYVDGAYTDGGSLPSGQYFGYNAFNTVTDGVDAPALSTGGTVHVAAGNYPESVAVHRGLVIQGAQHGTAGADTSGTARSGSESTVTSFDLDSNNVTIDGFSLANTGGIELNIATTSPAILTGTKIINNIFSDYGTVGMPTENAGNVAITGNYFTAPHSSGEPMQIKANVAGGCSGTNVSDNVFSNAGNNGGADINFSCTGSHSSGVTVSHNTDLGNSGGTSFVAVAGIDGDLSITHNTATSDGSNLYFWGGMVGSTTIANNTLTSGSSDISVHSSRDGANIGTFTIMNNTLSNSSNGIYVDTGALGTSGVMNVHGNTIADNSSYGVHNLDSSVTVDATGNWWGDASGPYHTTLNPHGLGNKVSDYVLFNPFCSDNGCTTLVSSGPIASIAMTANPASVVIPNSSTITIAAKDAGGYTVVNDNTSQFTLTADHGASLGSNLITLGTTGTTSTTVSNNQVGTVHVAAVLVSTTITGSVDVTFTKTDTTPPTVVDVSPADSSTGVSINVVPHIDFSEPLEQTTVDATSVKLSTATTTVAASLSLANGGTRVIITPDAPLDYSTQYTITVATSTTDLAANNLAAPFTSTFTTASATQAVLGVNGIDMVANANGSTGYATADGTYNNGWRWTFHVTVPDGQNYLAMKFGDFVSGANTILAGGNIRYYSAQSSDASTTASAMSITAANTYSTPIMLSGDTDATTPGRQVDITVEMKVPTSTPAGSYSASYGVETGTTTPII